MQQSFAPEVAAAIERSLKPGRGPGHLPAPSRRYAVGDPQTTRERFFRVLATHGLLGPDGWLRAGVGLVSLGDHFDFPGIPPRAAGAEGLAILRWLAAHPPEQVTILLGNHDTARVMELVAMTDERFLAARELALHICELEEEAAHEAEQRFAARYAELPSSGLVARDYAGFAEEQRQEVMRLLLAGRLRLAEAACLDNDRPILLTHAAVTERELELLHLTASTDCVAIAKALNAVLDAAVDEVRRPWQRGELLALSMAPLHVAGDSRREGGGLLYHRPANPETLAGVGKDVALLFDPQAPRRFHPRELPAGILQACGHSGHRSCLRDLQGWYTAEVAAAPAGLRSLRVHNQTVTYEMGIATGDGVLLHLADAEMNKVAPESYPLLWL